MTSITTKPDSLQPEASTAPHLFDDWFYPIETEIEVRGRAGSLSRNPSAASSMWPWSGRVMDAARWPAVKKERASWGIATGAGRGR